MFSVIIPLYNKALYIEKCLLSVLEQTFQNFEVIVVNDGSTDDGAEKVEKFKSKILTKASGVKIEDPDQNVRSSKFKLISQPNAGVSVARNNGVKAATFEYIAFLDADDWWEPTFLEEMDGLIKSFPQAGIYGSGYYLVKNNRKRVAPIGVEQSFNKGIINYCKVYSKTLCMPLTSASIVIRKTYFNLENGFKPVLKLGEDFDLWIRVALKYPVAFLNEPLANYNQDVELKNRSVGNLRDPGTHILWNLDYLSDYESTDPELKQLLDNLRVYGMLPYFLSGEYNELARKELNKVDWTRQPEAKVRLYKNPVFILKARQLFLIIGSFIKQALLRKTTRIRLIL